MVFCGWLSKQVKKLKLEQFKPSQSALTTSGGEGGCTREFSRLEDALLCIYPQKLPEVRHPRALERRILVATNGGVSIIIGGTLEMASDTKLVAIFLVSSCRG